MQILMLIAIAIILLSDWQQGRAMKKLNERIEKLEEIKEANARYAGDAVNGYSADAHSVRN